MIRAALAALAGELRAWRSWYFVRRPVLWSLTLYCVGILAWDRCSLHPIPNNDITRYLNQRACVAGVVDQQPDPRPSGTVVSLRLETVTVFTSTPAITRSVKARMLVHALGAVRLPVSPGDRVRACGTFSEPVSAQIPGVFDYAAFLENRGVDATIYTGGGSFQNWGESGHYPLLRIGWRIKQHVVERFDRALPADAAAVMAGLVVGQRPRFHPELRDVFLRSGTMHVLVASGSNVAFVMLIWFLLLRCVRIPSRWAIFSSLGPVWMYALVSGGDAPILRAAIMGSTFVIAHTLRRWDKPFNALGVAAWILLLLNPRSLFDVGFQMSFLTVGGLLLTMPRVEQALIVAPRWSHWPIRVLAASLTAQLWLVPVSLHSFHHLYLWSVFSNMLVVPAAALGLPLGLLLVVWKNTAPLVLIYADVLLWLVKTAATYLGARSWIAPLTWAAIVGHYVFLVSILKLRESALARLTTVLSLGLLWIGFTAHPSAPKSAGPTLTWIDTGRSTATLIENGQDRLLMLPLRGTDDQSLERVLLPFLTVERKRPITSLLVESSTFTASRIGREFVRALGVSSITVCAEPVVWFSTHGRTALIAPVFTIRLQRYLLEKMHWRPDVIAARFPTNWRWDQKFVEKFRPAVLVEMGLPRKNAGNNTPWENVPLVVPQRRGVYKWPDKLRNSN